MGGPTHGQRVRVGPGTRRDRNAAQFYAYNTSHSLPSLPSSALFVDRADLSGFIVEHQVAPIFALFPRSSLVVCVLAVKLELRRHSGCEQ